MKSSLISLAVVLAAFFVASMATVAVHSTLRDRDRYAPYSVMCTKDGRYSYTNHNGVVLGFYSSYQDAARMRDISKELEDKWQARQDEAMKEHREVQKTHWEVCPEVTLPKGVTSADLIIDCTPTEK